MTTQPVIIIVIINICTVLNCVFAVYFLRGCTCVRACVRACVRRCHIAVAIRLLYVNARIFGVLCHIVVISSKLNC